MRHFGQDMSFDDSNVSHLAVQWNMTLSKRRFIVLSGNVPVAMSAYSPSLRLSTEGRAVGLCMLGELKPK